MKTKSIIELLESRIAPATLVDAHTVTYTDVDFDLVTVKISKGTLADPNVSTDDFTFTGIPAFGQRLVLIDLSNDGTMFDGATLTITATRTAGGGDGHVNVGFIDSGGHDLGAVSIAGDLGRIVAGDADTATPGLKKLAVQSMGQFGTSTQSGGNLQTAITGPLGMLVVKGNMLEAAIDVFGANGTGKIGSVSVGGSIIGGAAVGSGSIETQGPIGSVKIGGDLRGGTGSISGRIHVIGNLGNVTIGGSIVGGGNGAATLNTGSLESDDMGMVKVGGDVKGGDGDSSGNIFATGKLAGVVIGGSLVGGGGEDSGHIQAGTMGAVKIGGDIRGGSGKFAGHIRAIGAGMASVGVGGSVVGGSGEDSGEIFSTAGIGAIKIGHDLRGGSASFSGDLRAFHDIASISIGGSLTGGTLDSGSITSSGRINAEDIGAVTIGHDLVGGSVNNAATADSSGYISGERIAAIKIGGSIIAGEDHSTGTLSHSGGIGVSKDIGSLVVKGSLIGNRVGDGQDVLIVAGGAASPTATADVAIKSLTVGGRVEFSRILAGYDFSGTGINGDGGLNADAQIGSVTVGGDWIASSIAAGATDGGNGFGNANDAKLTGGIVKNEDDTKLVSKIASIVIKGEALGTIASVNNTDFFGFVAQQIGSFKIGATSFPLMSGKANDTAGFLVGATSDLRLREIAL